MYNANAQGVDERMINVHYYNYYEVNTRYILHQVYDPLTPHPVCRSEWQRLF